MEFQMASDWVSGPGQVYPFGTIQSPMDILRTNIDSVFENVNVRWSLSDQALRALLGSYTIDEMALYFTSQELLMFFMRHALQRGWLAFNYDEDQVSTRPIESTYGVQYWFLRHEDFPYRLELMQVVDGCSPYHAAIEEMCRMHSIPLVLAHASFKVPGEEAYAAAGVALRNGGFEPAQHCTSSYGRFSYYIDADRADIPPIKPRINLRDIGRAEGMR